MRYKTGKLFIAFLILTSFSFGQSTYFIKYKNTVPSYKIENKIRTKKIIPANSLLKINPSEINITHFAKGLGNTVNDLFRIIKITFADDKSSNLIEQLASSDPEVEYIQKANTYRIDFTPNDSLLNKQWALSKINAFNAWNISQGSDSITLCIIDTGIDFLHPDLKNKIYINYGETGVDANGNDKRTNGVDDDGNGFIDDYMGWDFTDRQGFPFDSSGGDFLTWDNIPKDENGHGTAIAGIAGAETNNLIGIAGASPKIKLLNLRAFDPNGQGEEDDVAAAILYAVKMGAKIINMSFGDSQFSYVLRDVIRYAYSQNVILVASSGNSGSDEPHYPSGYSEVISVGNSTIDDYVSNSSNYGSTLDLTAPGTSIYTTAKDDGYAEVSGTSASAPFVSAAAGMILSINNFKNEEVKQILKSTCDDIGTSGWDIKSGAGRLNMYKALSVLAPAVIKFNYPKQDFATHSDTINISASVLSPYFQKYELYLGTGLNPDRWASLIDNGSHQISNKKIYALNIKPLLDTVYTLRLLVYLNNGNTSEERVSFHILRTSPTVQLVTLSSAYYGNKSTILSSVYTDMPCIVRMYYRKTGLSDFNFITLDGFAINNQYVNKLHYGFLPPSLIDQNANYEVYFEAENLSGLKTVLKQDGNFFPLQTTYHSSLIPEHPLPYTLPPGTLFQNPTNFISNNFNEILLNQYYPGSNIYYSLYQLSGNSFQKVDSIENRIPRAVGDFNNNGKIDLLSSIQRNGFIDEQTAAGVFKFSNKTSDSTGEFWPITAADLYSNDKIEILSMDSDTSITVWNLDAELKLSNPIRLFNYTAKGLGGNLFNSPNAVITDLDGDGKKEIWMVDDDGDIFDYRVTGPGQFQKDNIITTNLAGSTAYLTAGDYNGDGKTELAVLLHSVISRNIAPFYKLIIFNISSKAVSILFSQAFVDASSEFQSSFLTSNNSLRFADVDKDGNDELILFTFHYSYIFKFNSALNSVISYKENINSNSVFIGDLNKNGIPEIAFPAADGIVFSEFSVSSSAFTPANIKGYSIDKSHIALKWDGDGQKYFIYRGIDKNNLYLLDSTYNTDYIDKNLLTNKYYFYGIKSYDSLKQNRTSDMSKIISVYSHIPGTVKSVINNSPSSIVVSFSEKIKTTVDNLSSFEVIGLGIPGSVSPNDQYSYLLSFKNNLPAGLNRLIISKLNDYYGSPVNTDTISFNVDFAIANKEFFITSFQILEPYKIKIEFNLDVDEAGVLNLNNYSFIPENKVSAVEVDKLNKKIVYLNLTGNKPVGSIGIEYSLSIKNIYSSAATGKIKINSGAGSYIVLTDFAKNLSDVYVYPSPARVLGGEGKITFANIPKRAKITIWSLSGVMINNIEENNGDGGVEFKLRDISGNPLNSGIYIYRIVKLDDLNNEVEEKISKFAVIK